MYSEPREEQSRRSGRSGASQEPSISGMQQVGVGAEDAESAFSWYRRAFGMDIPIFDDAGRPILMTRYTGGTVQERRAILAANLAGGGGFEIWQYTGRKPQPPSFEPAVGDLGILAARIKTPDPAAVPERLARLGLREAVVSSVSVAPWASHSSFSPIMGPNNSVNSGLPFRWNVM